MSDDYQRHSELIDKMFLFGLTSDEATELEQIRGRLDDLEEDWYAPIIRKFEKLYPAPAALTVPADVMSQKEIERKIVHYERTFDMSSQELLRQMKEGTAPDTFETMAWMILLRYRTDDPALGPTAHPAST